MNELNKILIVEDNPADAELAKREIRQILELVEFSVVFTENAFLDSLKNFRPDIIISDYSMPNFDGMAVISLTKKNAPLTPVIIYTGSLNEETAAETVKEGAVDYVLKENTIRLRQAVISAYEKKQLWKDRFEAEEKLRESEERYRLLFEQAADGIIRVAPGGRVIDINTSGAEILGYSKPKILTMFADELFEKEELAKKPFRYDLLDQGRTVKIERTIIGKDGHHFEVEMHSKMMPDKTYQSIIRDITNRKKAETSLKESEERLNNLIQNIPYGIVIHSQGKIVFANETAKRIIEIPEDISAEGLNAFDFVHPEFKETALSRIKNSMNGHTQTDQQEGSYMTYSGKKIPVEIKSLPITYKGAYSLLTVFNDISERKRAEELLKQSEAKYRSFFESTGTAIAICEEDFTLSLVNTKYSELIGLSKKEIENKKKFSDFVMPEELYNLVTANNERRENLDDAPKSFEFKFKNVKGEIRNILMYTDSIPGTKKRLTSLLDITDRKKAEEELHKNRVLLRSLIDSLPMWIGAVDLQGNIIIANEHFTKTFKIGLDSIEGHNTAELLAPETYTAHRKLLHECRITGKRKDVSDVFEFEKGKLIYVYGTYTPLYYSEKNLYGYSIGLMDITEQKKAENLLIESEKQFRTTFENAPIGMCLNDLKGKFFQANQSFCHMMGYSQAELINLNFLDITYTDDKDSSNNFIYDLLNNKESSAHIEKRYIRKDGSVLWAITTASVMRDVNENSKFFIVQVIDITELKITEQNLSEAKHQLEVVFDNGPDAILLTRIDDGHYIDSNKTFTKYTGYTPDDLRGKSTLDIDIWENPGDRKTLLSEIQKKGFCHNLELIVKNKNGTFRTIEMSAEVVFIKGAPHLLTTSRDIAERKIMEELLQKQNVELQELVATKDRFFSIIAHDLKDPHNAILGFSEILSTNYEILSDQDKKNYIKNILLSSQLLSRLLQNLLEWAGSQTGRMVYQPENLDVTKLIKETFELLLYQAKIKQIRLICDIESSLIVYADSNMIRTVLRNLVSNAIKFTNRNGFVKVSAAIISDATTQKPMVEISVSDNGVGISKENLEKLFKLDYKIKTQGTEDEMGSGLGLILCKELVRKNKGFMNITSEENVGSTVTLALPENKS